MNETSKTKIIWGEMEKTILCGKGIDIGCGADPVSEDVRKFDIAQGDAGKITHFVHEQFDYVYSSHCLEHMDDPADALRQWWQLVKPGGHLFFIVPDEDLYEQGVFPSRFNVDHKATFTVSKRKSWSPVSYNVFDLACSLPNSKIIGIELQDIGYDRQLYHHGPAFHPNLAIRALRIVYTRLASIFKIRIRPIEILLSRYWVVDQTRMPGVLAQIQCIIKKLQ